MFFGFTFMMIPVLILIIWIFIIFAFIHIVKQRRYNKNQPQLAVMATVVTKRVNAGYNSDMPRSRYFATFQVESGDRMEFIVPAQEYGMLAEGDYGKLRFQGNQYLSFERA